jgi:hypothetical protein
MSDDRYRGLMSREEWAKTPIGATSRYACQHCGQEFPSPHDVYDHLDAEHPKETKR